MKASFAVSALCACLASAAGPAAGADPEQIRLSALLGTRVETPRGEPLGWIVGVLLDSRPRGQHYALLAVDDGPAEKRFAYPVNSLRRGGGEELLLDVPPYNLEHSPGYQDRAWPAPQFRSGERYVRANGVVGTAVLDPLGKRVGVIEDMVIRLDTGRTQSVLLGLQGGDILPVPEHEMRLAPGGPATLYPAAQRRS